MCVSFICLICLWFYHQRMVWKMCWIIHCNYVNIKHIYHNMFDLCFCHCYTLESKSCRNTALEWCHQVLHQCQEHFFSARRMIALEAVNYKTNKNCAAYIAAWCPHMTFLIRFGNILWLLIMILFIISIFHLFFQAVSVSNTHYLM